MLTASLSELKNTITDLEKDEKFLANFEKATDVIKKAVLDNKQILIAGNGGSAADAQHFAAELVGRFIKERKSLPAIALTTDTSILTAVGNDYGFDKIFERQVMAHGGKGDIFIGISTSGNSENIINAVKAAKQKEMITICLLGNNGGILTNTSDYSIIIPSNKTPRIQELHTAIIHIICEEIDKLF